MTSHTDDIYGDLPPIGVGQEVPEFKMETYEPNTGSFGEVNLENLKKDGKWTILVKEYGRWLQK